MFFFSFGGIIRTVDSIPSGLYDNVYDMRTKEGSVYPFTEKLMGARCVAVVVGWWIDGERERGENESGVVPEDWRCAVIVLLYKGKVEKSECKNCRGISLLSGVGKIYVRVLEFVE